MAENHTEEEFEYVGDPEDEKRLKVALADCIITWSNVEISLGCLFSTAMDDNTANSLIIWDSLVGFNAKIKCLISIVENNSKLEKHIKIFEKLIKKNQKSAITRNKIAHSGMVGGRRKGKSMAFLMPYFSIYRLCAEPAKQEKFSANDLVKVNKHFKNLEEANRWLSLSVTYESNEELRGKVPERTPDLINSIQESIG